MKIQIEQHDTYQLWQLQEKSLTEEVAIDIAKSIRKSERDKVFIIELATCNTMEAIAGPILLELHQWVYQNGGSLVFADLSDELWQIMKQEQLHLSLNLTPTLIEAVDIVSMDILERDLLGEA